MQGRGLKRRRVVGQVNAACVAPYAGAWIETFDQAIAQALDQSPLMQGRGLKQRVVEPGHGAIESPLMQGRGLKPARD